MISNNYFSVSTPQLLWHGGGNENGKTDPVYSLDYLLEPSEAIRNTAAPRSVNKQEDQSTVLLTTGIDANVPPKGSVRLWRVDPISNNVEFLIDLADHQSAVNVARFSPCGKMIASASDRQIVIYVVSNPKIWKNATETRMMERIWLRPTVTEMFDLSWSPDSSYVVVGAIDHKAEIIRIATRDTLIIPGHSNYVQGVAWDPYNQMIITQSVDRSCKAHQLKFKEGSMIKLAQRGHVVIKMHGGYAAPVDPTKVLSAADFGITSKDDENGTGSAPTGSSPGINLFVDYNVPCFFRRLCFTPDGQLLISPTGIHKPPGSDSSKSFCTHIFSRNQLQSPYLSLIGLEEPSVAVRCCPQLFKLIPYNTEHPLVNNHMIQGDYRIIFAVVTTKSIFIYDTQHHFPLAKITGLHFATLNDASWSSNGRLLTVCSSDGYLTFIRFRKGALGVPIDDCDVPEIVKISHPYLYKYSPTRCDNSANKSLSTMPAIATTASPTSDIIVSVSVDEEQSPSSVLNLIDNDNMVDKVNSNNVDNNVDNGNGKNLEEVKKRKRIAPTPVILDDVMSLKSSSVNVENDHQGMESVAPIVTLIVNENKEAENDDISPFTMLIDSNDVTLTVKSIIPSSTEKKKRITPTKVPVESV
eukprot:gene5152-7172_t